MDDNTPELPFIGDTVEVQITSDRWVEAKVLHVDVLSNALWVKRDTRYPKFVKQGEWRKPQGAYGGAHSTDIIAIAIGQTGAAIVRLHTRIQELELALTEAEGFIRAATKGQPRIPGTLVTVCKVLGKDPKTGEPL